MASNYEKTSRNGVSFSALFLILLGIVFLLNNFGLLPWEIWQNLWKFWPLLLILFGVEIIIGRHSSPRTLFLLILLIFLVPVILILNPLTGNPLANGKLTVDHNLATLTKANLDFELPSSNIKLSSLPRSSSQAVIGSVTYSQILPKPTLGDAVRFGEAQYSFSQSKESLPFLNNLGNKVDLKLSPLIPFEIKVKANTGVFNFDFTNLKVDQIEINSGAGQVNINYPNSSSSKTYIQSAAGLVSLKIPAEVGAMVKTSSSFKSFNISSRKFIKVDSSNYKSKNWDSATYKVSIEISGQAASITIK